MCKKERFDVFDHKLLGELLKDSQVCSKDWLIHFKKCRRHYNSLLMSYFFFIKTIFTKSGFHQRLHIIKLWACCSHTVHSSQHGVHAVSVLLPYCSQQSTRRARCERVASLLFRAVNRASTLWACCFPTVHSSLQGGHAVSVLLPYCSQQSTGLAYLVPFYAGAIVHSAVGINSTVSPHNFALLLIFFGNKQEVGVLNAIANADIKL